MTVASEACDRWTRYGGTTEVSKGRTTYITPAGKKLRTWKEASALLNKQENRKEGAQ